MEKIVDRALKIDLHIHSWFSHRKDKESLIGKNNIQNIDKLFIKLQENKIDMFSITDHDYFSYALYSELRKKAKAKLSLLLGK